MRKRYLASAVLLGATLMASSAFAQGTTGSPGTDPEGSTPGVTSGSGQQAPGTTTKHGTSSKMTKHHETNKKSQNKM
jgi:ABC-type Fe3+-siderophore transport system permease subunit